MTTFITPILRKTALGTAGLALCAGAVTAPLATAAHAAPPAQAAVSAAHAGKAKGDQGETKELAVDYRPQPNFYYCGPAAVRNALTADGHAIDMDEVARQMGTTEAGTDSAHDITAALNKATGGKEYQTTEISGRKASGEQKAKLREHVRGAIDAGRAVVANVAGTATDTDGGVHSYEGGHYIAVHAYRDGGQQVRIADSANPDTASYWIDTDELAGWIATRGYSH